MMFGKMVCLSFLFLVFFAHSLFAQSSNQCVLRGKVTDLAANPLPLATIRVEDSAKNVFAADVDKEGNYVFRNLACGTMTATFEHWGFYKETIVTNLAAGLEKSISLGLVAERVVYKPVIKLTGKILDESGVPIEGAFIKITHFLNERIVSRAFSSAKGVFEITLENEGKYLFEASAKDKRTHQFEITVDDLKTQDIKLKNIVLRAKTK